MLAIMLAIRHQSITIKKTNQLTDSIKPKVSFHYLSSQAITLVF